MQPQGIETQRYRALFEGNFHFPVRLAGGQDIAAIFEIGAPVTALFQQPLIVPENAGSRRGIDLGQMAFAVQLVDGDIVQADRRAIFDLRPHHPIGERDPVIAAAEAAVQADAFAAQHFGHLQMNGGRAQ